MAQHVGPHPSETGALAGSADQVVDRLPRHGLASFGDEQPSQVVVAGREVPLDRPELVAFDGLLGVERVSVKSFLTPLFNLTGEVGLSRTPQRHRFLRCGIANRREPRANFWNFVEVVHLLALMVVFAIILLIAGYTVRLFIG